MRRNDPSRQPRRHNGRGFSLIELMIGIVVGLLTVLVITQVLALSESRNRTVATGSDAQSNGSLALFTLQREVEMAGYGATASPDALGCTVKYKKDAATAAGSFVLAPALITPGAGGGPDSLTLLEGRPAVASMPIPLKASLPGDAPLTAFKTDNAIGVQAGDALIAVPASRQWESAPANHWCTLALATHNAASAGTTLGPLNVPHEDGPWNQPIFPASGYAGAASNPRSYLLNVGNLVVRTFSVSPAFNLQSQDPVSIGGDTAAHDLFAQIVSLKVLYGKDTDADGRIDLYDQVTPTTNAEWLQVNALRLAVVARSQHYEKDAVTPQAPAWDVGTAATIGKTAGNTAIATTDCNSGSKCIALTVSHTSPAAEPQLWQHYRYKVYDTIVPLRNVLWNLP